MDVGDNFSLTELETAEHLVLKASSDGLRGARLGHEGRDAENPWDKVGYVDPALEEAPLLVEPWRAYVALWRVGPLCSLHVPVYRRADGVAGSATDTVSPTNDEIKGTSGAGVAACPYPLEDRQSVDYATAGEVALDEDVPHCVLAAELAAALCLVIDLSNGRLEKPEADLGVAVIREAVQAIVDDQVAGVVLADGRTLVDVGGGEGVGDVIFVRHLLLCG